MCDYQASRCQDSQIMRAVRKISECERPVHQRSARPSISAESMAGKEGRRRVAVVGSGVAGVCAAESALRQDSDCEVALISPSAGAKRVENVQPLSRTIETFDVVERPLDCLCRDVPLFKQRLIPYLTSAKLVDTSSSTLHLTDGSHLSYDALIWCAGAQPKQISGSEDAPPDRVITLRDSDSVRELAHRLGSARSIGIIGNGGIALELAGALRGARHQVLWLAKHRNIGDAFLDQDAAHFLAKRAGLTNCSPNDNPNTWRASGEQERDMHSTQSTLSGKKRKDRKAHGSRNGSSASHCDAKQQQGVPAGAVGPDWVKLLSGVVSTDDAEDGSNIAVELEEEAVFLQCNDDQSSSPVTVTMASGKQHRMDVCVFAAGVVPNTEPLAQCQGAHVDDEDGGILVNSCMQAVGLEDKCVYVAGDACTCSWAKDWNESPHWFQMRLWTQARTLGAFAGACAVGAADELAMGYNLEVFAHTTRFLGEDVILLGRYNAQKMDDVDQGRLMSYCREIERNQFVRITTLDGRAIGSVLIGDTDLAETMENLIMNRIDVSQFGAELLDPEIDLEDYFD